MPGSPSGRRVGVVFGGGGVLGAAWLVGAVGALVRETGWDPMDADLLMGTSAGSVVAALVAGMHQPWRLVEAGFEDQYLDVFAAATYRFERPERLGHWGSWRMLVETWKGGGDAVLQRLWAGALPHGLVSTRPLEEMVDNRVQEWPATPRLWLVATDYQSGQRHVFDGRAGDPSVGRAVAASCAIPGFYRPVRIDSSLFVDGGVSSSSNIDLLCGSGLDLLVCLLPLSPVIAAARRSPFNRFRAALQQTLMRQIREVEAAGTPVLLIEPEGRAADVIGLNFMNRTRTRAVAHSAIETVRERLRQPEVAALLEMIRARTVQRA